MSKEYQECVYNLWTGFVGKATCEAGYLKCDGFSCPLYTPKKESKQQTNYERLISKTPEQLAKTIVGWLADAAELCGENRQSFDIPKAEEYTISWLKSPAEEE